MRIAENLQEPKYVAFLDVLGFKDLVQQKGEKLNTYFEIIEKALNDIRVGKKTIDSQLVSDSIILACEISNENFTRLLKAVQIIQSRCALQNIWLRGAITIGEIHFNHWPSIVVGNGLTQAYLLESQEKFPRVIINPAIIQNFQTRKEFIKTFNSNNTALIFEPKLTNNFIENDAFFVEFAEHIIGSGVDNLGIIYNHLKSELYMGQQNYKKYLWLKNYFTEAIGNFLLRFKPMRFIFNNLSQQDRRIEATCDSYFNRFQSL